MKDLDSPIKACPALDAGSGNDGSVDSMVPTYVIPWLACRAEALCEGWTTESTTCCLYIIMLEIRDDKSLHNNKNFYPPLAYFLA